MSRARQGSIRTGARRVVRVRRSVMVAFVAGMCLVLGPIGDIIATAEDPPATPASSPAPADSSGTPSTPASSPTSDGAGTDPATPSSTEPAPSPGPAGTTATTGAAPSGAPSSSDPSTSAGDAPPGSSPRPLAVAAILGAPNPLDAAQGFSVLARHDGRLLGGTTVGAVAVGGDLTFGPYEVVPRPAAQLDERPIGLLVGGSVDVDRSAGQLRIGAGAELLMGDVSTDRGTQVVAAGAGVAVVRDGAAADAEPQVRATGPQDVDTVASPGTFLRAFGGVFADLARRGRTLAARPDNVTLSDGDGRAADIDDGGAVRLAGGDGTGPAVWSVTARQLERLDSVTVDRAPTAEQPLVINVDGEGGKVRLSTPVTVPAAARDLVLFNVVDAPSVAVAAPLPGSLLAPTAAVTIDADVAGTVVAGSVRQQGGSVGGAPFAAELPKVAGEGIEPTTEPPTTTAVTSEPADPGGAEAVPPATGNNAVITVKVGGDRTSTSAVGSLAGVTLQLYDGTNAPTTPAVGAFTTCVSDVDGDCSFIVPNTQGNGANRDRRFWVVRTGTPAGWFGLSSLVTGASPPFASTPYQFRTGDQLRAGNTYASSGPNATFMLSTGNTNATASGGIWQSSRNNPSLPSTCGLNVALVLDLSGSVAPSIAALRTAARTFTNSLVGTPSQLALFTFASTAPANTTNNQNRPLTPVSTQAGADTVNAWIDGLTASGGTNWDRGIFQVAQSGTRFDVAIVITDGNPTYYGNTEGPGNYTRLREVENGIFSANAVKAESTRMIAVGVGDGVSGPTANLVSISGPTAGSDYYQTTDYTQAGAALRALALGNCQGTISVIKQVVPSTAPPGSTTGAAPAGGWQFGATTSTSGVTIAPTSGTTASGSGALNFDLTFPGGTTTAPVTVTETSQPGYTLVQQGGVNATCRRLDTNAAVTVTNAGASGFVVSGATAYPVSCTVYNRAPAPGATVVVDKTWVINGQSFSEGSQPADFAATLSIGGTPQGWGVVRTGFQQGDSTVINETVQLSRLQCTLDSARVTLANGATVSSPLPFTATLAEGANSYTITNTVTCVSRLTLVKDVQGTAPATAWTLSATAPAGALPGPSGTTGVTATVTAGARYVLAESAGDPRYVQRADPAAVPIPGSTVSWSCVEVDASGNVIPGFADGLNGGVTMPIGTFVRCTAVNQTATLTLIKTVTNDNGGTATPADWQLTATPIAPVAPGLTPVTVTGSAAGATFQVRPGQGYLLTESGPSGYTLVSVTCTVEQNVPRQTTTLTLGANEAGTCAFANDDQPGRLTLVKQVDNGTTGATAAPADWLLAASGPTPISGRSGTPAVTDVTVNAGTYTLSESGGPAGFTASAWSCTGASPSGANVTVPPGGSVTCTITNTAIAPRLTLVKQVDNGTTGATATPADWTLAAAGPTPLSGQSGTPAVTAVAVPVGTYTLSESGGPTGYTASAWSCVGASAAGDTVTLTTGQQATCTIVNTAVAPRLTLVKQVVNTSGGTASAREWLLAATGAVTIQGRVGDATITDAVVPVGPYSLAESGGPAGYLPSAWSCTGAAGFDPAAAAVTLGAGDRATCAIVNTDQPANLTLVKEVDPAASGSGRVPADWTLTATPVAITGQGPVSGNGDPASPGGVEAVTVFSGSYDLSEDGPAGFTSGSWVCQGAVVTGVRVVVPPGGTVRCTITNTAVTPRLTLVKVVDNGTTGATTPASAWTLTASGPTPISGSTGSLAVTDAAVQVGTYTLSESGPPGYTASAWSCTGATSATASSVSLEEGQSATCTITNTAIPPQLTLVKVVDNGTTGGTAEPTDWTLAAAGPVTISGASGTPAVTGAIVPVGSYGLSESGGPGGYDATPWSCLGGAPGPDIISLVPGDRAICTITNTAQPASLTLVKAVDNGTTGATATPADWTLAASGPTPLSGLSGDPAVTAVPVQIGDYALSESGGPTGYAASDWACVGAPVTSGTATIALGQDAICTITNTAIAPTLTLVKQVVNSSGGTAQPTDWLLSATGAVTIEGPTGDAAVTDAVVPIGDYVLAEAGGPVGYTAGAWSCTGASASDPLAGTVTLAPGDGATCTITNTDQPAALTLIKVVDPAATGSGRVPADWTLTATPVGIAGQGPVSGNGDPSSAGGVNAVPVFSGAYDLSETGPTGFAPGSWVCEGAVVTGARVAIAPGGVVRCTITNIAVSPTLTLVKVVDNGTTGATTPATAWTLSASGPTPVSGVTGSPAVTAATVQIGTYDLAESGPAGYTASTWECTGASSSTATSVTVVEGEAATCTITNTAVPPRLTLVKVVDATAAGGTAVPTDWTLTASGPTSLSGASGEPDVTAVTVPVGEYALSESGGPAGYTASAWSCVGGTAGAGSVTLGPGDDATCTITNTAVPPTLTLVKVVDNGTTGASTPATAWTLSATGPVSISGATGTAGVTAVDVQVGDYTLGEAGPAGYTTSSWSCTGAASSTAGAVSLTEGQNATCTITNTAIAPTLTLVKEVVNTSGGTAVPTDWILTATGPVTVTGRTGEPAITGALVPVGEYQLAESAGDPGYVASAWVCSGNATAVSPAGQLVLAVGEDVTCTITNTDRPATLTLAKVVDAAGSGSGRVPADWTLTATPVGITGQGPVSGNGDPTSPGGVDAVEVLAGNYQLSESGPAGFDPGSWICQGGVVNGTTVTVPVQGTVVCEITNQAVAPRLTLVKVVDNGATGATAVPTDWTLSASGPTPISGATGSAAVTDAPVQVGTYTLGETGPPGYTAGPWSCDGATVTGATLALAEGQVVTCTIVNTAAPGVWELTKLADPPSGTTVDPGATIAYTLLAEHESGAPISGATATDDLSKVLPYATIVTPLPTGLTLVGTTLTWAIPDIPIGGSASTTFRVTVRADAGGATVFNVAAPSSSGGHCTPCETTHPVRLRPNVTPTDPPVTGGSGISIAGISPAGPVRWAILLVVSGAILLVVSVSRRPWRRRRPQAA